MKNSDNLIFGRNPVKESILAKKVNRIYLAKNFSHSEILSLIEKFHISFSYVSNEELSSACPGVHQGIAAEIKPYEYYSFESILNRASKKEKSIIVLLDGINDPHNLGAIMRSCDVFDVDGIIIPKHNQVPLNSTVAKTSAGAINFVPVAMVSNLNMAIQKLKEAGFWIVSSDGSGQQNYNDLKYDFKVGLVIGSEGNGISSLVLKNSDYVIKIPQYGHVNSLNASVATGILLANIRQ